MIGTKRGASFAASRVAVSTRSMKISASIGAYSLHIALPDDARLAHGP
jgi:hypothetical protein